MHGEEHRGQREQRSDETHSEAGGTRIGQEERNHQEQAEECQRAAADHQAKQPCAGPGSGRGLGAAGVRQHHGMHRAA